MRNGGKHILKDASRDIVPSEIIDRRKGYFPVPGLRYLRGPFLYFGPDVLQRTRSPGTVTYSTGHTWTACSLDLEGERHLKGHSKLWQVAVLEAWLQNHDIN